MSMNLLASSAALLLWTANAAYAAEAPYGGTAAAIPGTVQAENYDTGGQGVAYSVSSTNGSGNSYRTDGIDLEATTDTGGGYDMGWTTGGQWFRYTVNMATDSDTSYFASLGVPKSNIVLGVPFFGQSSDGSISETYATILAAYPGAASENQVSGGSLDGGVTLYYVGDATMAEETQLGVRYGGVMIWELSQYAAPPNSLLTIIQNNL